MKIIWDENKNTYIKSRPWWGWIWFEDIEKAIRSWSIWFDWENESKRYCGQQVMVVIIWEQIFKVPYNKVWDTIELITAFPTPKYNHLFKI